MKRVLILLSVLIFTATTAYAVSLLTRDSNGIPIQAFSPRGDLTTSLTVKNTTTDMRPLTAGAVYSAIACKVRFMNRSSSSVKTSFTQSTIPAGVYYTRVVSPNTPFWNLSGCIGTFERQ